MDLYINLLNIKKIKSMKIKSKSKLKYNFTKLKRILKNEEYQIIIINLIIN